MSMIKIASFPQWQIEEWEEKGIFLISEEMSRQEQKDSIKKICERADAQQYLIRGRVKKWQGVNMRYKHDENNRRRLVSCGKPNMLDKP